MRRIIIISDIDTDKESIIPYGLNIGKYTETEVDILHVIDPRLSQGTYSPYADSKSITPGKKLTHEEIIQKEKNKARSALDRLLSKEASRLNYPLKINLMLEVENVEKVLKDRLDALGEPFLVTGTEPGSAIAGNLSELLSMIGDTDCLILTIPSGYEFSEPGKAVLVTDFSEVDYDRIKQTFRLLKPFKPLVYACAFVKMKHFLEMELKAKAWEQVVKTYVDPPLTLKASVLKGDDQAGNLRNYIQRNNPGMVILPKNKRTALGEIFSRKENIKELIESLNRPVLFY